METVQVLKRKNGVASKIEYDGRVYALVPNDYINGNKNKHIKQK